jgi:hypothetical protein
MSMKEQMLAAGVSPADIDHWCSDLYVKVTPVSKKVVEGYEFKCNVQTFRSQIDSTAWYDIPFAYEEYHTRGLVVEVLNG